MKKVLLSLLALGSFLASNAQGTPAGSDSQLPPNPEPGKCYVKCITPDVWTNEKVRVLKTPAYKKLKVIPAVYETVTEEYIETPSYKKFKVIPATFKYETVSYTSKEGRTDLKVIPEKFSNSSETVEIKSGYSKWEYTTKPDCKSPNPGDCKYVCFKEYPSEFKTVPTRTVANAYTSNVPVNEQKASYKKRILTPSRVEEITVPAVKKTYTRKKLVTPAKTVETNIDAVYTTVDKTVLTTKGGVTVWEEVACENVSGVVLPIYYNLGSAAITSASRKIIDKKLYTYMKANPNQVIEIASHTDSRGNDASNLDLSERRAKSVVDYLISKGINASRLVAKGYGETSLRNYCSNGKTCTEAQHRENRRTEFRVVSQ